MPNRSDKFKPQTPPPETQASLIARAKEIDAELDAMSDLPWPGEKLVKVMNSYTTSNLEKMVAVQTAMLADTGIAIKLSAIGDRIAQVARAQKQTIYLLPDKPDTFNNLKIFDKIERKHKHLSKLAEQMTWNKILDYTISQEDPSYNKKKISDNIVKMRPDIKEVIRTELKSSAQDRLIVDDEIKKDPGLNCSIM